MANQTSWMEKLAEHHRRMRACRPHDRLIILFDIDGTVLDNRYLVLNILRSYDGAHGTGHFKSLRAEDVVTYESKVRDLLLLLGLPPEERERVAAWYDSVFRSSYALPHAHRPFPGVMEVIRWFQLRPNTFVGLNTGRTERIRQDTLDCLRAFGREHHVRFDVHLLRMNPYGWGSHIPRAKVEAVQWFQDQGYRVIAMVDNEPANLAAIAEADPRHEILLLHADTLFESRREALPARTIAGDAYDLDLVILPPQAGARAYRPTHI